MKDAYVTFDAAKRLKESGFDWECRTKYNSNGCIHDNIRMSNGKFMTNLQFFPQEYSAPTQQMAMRWLREERGIHIYPIPITGFYYVVSVYAEQGNKIYDRILSRSGRHAYEDVVEAVLEYVLTNLI